MIALPKTWKELDEIDGYFVHSGSTDIVGVIGAKSVLCNRDIFATKEQAEASNTLAQLSQLMQVYNNGWVPDFTDDKYKYTIEQYKDEFIIETRRAYSVFLVFEKFETATLFLENFKDLIIIAKPLL